MSFGPCFAAITAKERIDRLLRILVKRRVISKREAEWIKEPKLILGYKKTIWGNPKRK